MLQLRRVKATSVFCLLESIESAVANDSFLATILRSRITSSKEMMLLKNSKGCGERISPRLGENSVKYYRLLIALRGGLPPLKKRASIDCEYSNRYSTTVFGLLDSLELATANDIRGVEQPGSSSGS